MINNKGRILIVDDDATHLDLLTELLTNKGFNCKPEVDGLDGLEYLLRYDYVDVVIADLNMPIMGGEKMLLEARKRGNTTPFIIVPSLDTDSF